MHRIIIFSLLLTFISNAFSQEAYLQNIRGQVIDKQSKYPLPGASIIIIGSEPLKGTTTDANGYFNLIDAKAGRISLTISFMGYSPVTINNLLLTTGKELILTVELEEMVLHLDEVSIRPKIEKDQANNKMASVSARSFTIEETQRYAGSLGDPARMAANFAGVHNVNDSRNDIIIRGNSPTGLSWRLDGVEIPNPNHFGALGTTGGPVSMLNNNLLTNSDFLTSAFPAEYGNALAGAFDLKMRSGNNRKTEFTGQMGFNGLEAGIEGQFSKNHSASYLVNYRYSIPAFFDLFHSSGIQGSSVPYYQDFCFKIDIPGIKYGKFSIFGLGGKSDIRIYDSDKDSTEFSYGLKGTNMDFGALMGVTAITHQYFITSNTRLFSTLSTSYSRSFTLIDSIVKQVEDSIAPWLHSDFQETKYAVSTQLSHKINTKNLLVTGIIANLYHANYVDSMWSWHRQGFYHIAKANDYLWTGRSYVQWQHRFSDQLSLNSGINVLISGINNEVSPEPRLGLRWNYAANKTLSFGSGLHSQLQPRMIYFINRETSTGEDVYSNKNVKLSKSAHFVIGHDWSINEHLRFKAETYYQNLFNIPVSHKVGWYSMLNEGAFFAFSNIDSLVNNGSGYNYGLEFTLEKFLSRGYYFLITASLFDSRYIPYDGIVRNTVFNSNYVFNALGGYEIKIGQNKHLAFDLRTVWAGGKRYVPINIEESLQKQQSVYDYDKAYEKKHPDYFKTDIRIAFRVNGKKINQEWALDIKNISNHKNIFGQSYDFINDRIHTDYQEGRMPMFLYRINF